MPPKGFRKDDGSGRIITALETPFKFTRREYETLFLMAAGYSNKEAAEVLGLSPRTVEIHRARSIEKMGAPNGRIASVVAVLSGVVPMDLLCEYMAGRAYLPALRKTLGAVGSKPNLGKMKSPRDRIPESAWKHGGQFTANAVIKQLTDIRDGVQVMAKTDWYTVVRQQRAGEDDFFQVLKFDKDGEYQDSYEVNLRMTKCNCPAHVPYCRHKQIVLAFQEAGRLGQGWTYNHDRKEWSPPKDMSKAIGEHENAEPIKVADTQQPAEADTVLPDAPASKT
jgi:DNA-binding CsgD family transcriptional regulator